jgi:putative Mg2+ transporter-C (MgtC) family protein
MMEMFLEFVTKNTAFEYLVPVLLAALAGGLIGIEREYRDKTAGFRTMILISVGSCLFTIFSDVMGEPDGESTRIAASIVTGVGFLGAGTIIKDGATVRGLTTAASIWLVASLGMGAALGLYTLIFTVAIFVLLVLILLPPIERWLDKKHDFSEFHITIKNSDKEEDKILDMFYDFGIEIAELRYSRVTKSERILHVRANMTVVQREELSAELVSENAVLAFEDK